MNCLSGLAPGGASVDRRHKRCPLLPVFSIAAVLLALLAASCGSRRAAEDEFVIPVYMPRYASGFEILGAEGRKSTLVRVHNPWQGAEGVDFELFIARDGEAAPEGFEGQILQGEPSRIVCMSSTYIAMLDAVGAVNRIVGVSGLNYVSNAYVTAHRESIGDVGYEGNVDYELLLALSPDVVLLYGLNGANGMEGKLRELGIPFVYMGDYLEQSPLGKAEWMIVAGEIMGCRGKAEAVYAGIPQRYNALKELVASASVKAPAVMLNVPYGDSWLMAPANSYVARTIADAGGDYVYRKNTTNRSLPVDMEEAALLVSRADVWIEVGDIRTLGELKRRLPKLADAACIRNGRVWNSDRRSTPSGGNDYWESGVIHPDVILRDLVKIFHPELEPEYEPVYYRQLP